MDNSVIADEGVTNIAVFPLRSTRRHAGGISRFMVLFI
jgi:hypothetical protein